MKSCSSGSADESVVALSSPRADFESSAAGFRRAGRPGPRVAATWRRRRLLTSSWACHWFTGPAESRAVPPRPRAQVDPCRRGGRQSAAAKPCSRRARVRGEGVFGVSRAARGRFRDQVRAVGLGSIIFDWIKSIVVTRFVKSLLLDVWRRFLGFKLIFLRVTGRSNFLMCGTYSDRH